MSVSAPAATNYISNEDLMLWLETKTEGMYENMRGAMDLAEDRANLGQAMNKIKAELQSLDTSSPDAERAVKDEIDALIKQYPDQKEVRDALQPITDTLGQGLQIYYDAVGRWSGHIEVSANELTAAPQNIPPGGDPRNGGGPESGSEPPLLDQPGPAPTLATIDKSTIDNWGKQLDDAGSFLDKQDQLGLIRIGDINNQINQTKQIASNLMDSQSKTASAMIMNIKV